MRQIFYFVTVLLCLALAGCSSDSDDVTPLDGPEPLPYRQQNIHEGAYYTGKFKVAYFDGENKIGEGEILASREFVFYNMPWEYIIPKILSKDETFTLDEDQKWNSDFISYTPREITDSTFVFNTQMAVSSWESRFLWFPGTYNNKPAGLVTLLHDSAIAYNRLKDQWVGNIMIKTLRFINSKGEELDRKDLSFPYIFYFRSTGRIEE